MSRTNYKVTFSCDCGENYGSCEKRSLFILEYDRSVDIGSLFFKNHADDEGSKMEFLGSFSDKGIEALVKVLTIHMPDESLDDSDLKEIKDAR